MLTEGTDGAASIRQVALTPSLRTEAQQFLAVLDGRVHDSPAEPTRLYAELVRHALALGVADRSDAEWADLFSIYEKTLAQFSLTAIQGAFLRWNRCELYPKEPGRHGFFPKPAELFELAQREMNEARIAHYRAKKALEFVENKGLEWTPQRKREERQKAIDAGYLTADGKLNVESMQPRKMPGDTYPQRSAQQVAAALRAHTPDIEDVI